MDYEAFDAKMIELIGSGKAVTASVLTAMLDSDAKPFVKAPGQEFRVIDRRLQAMRKRGVIGCRRVGQISVWHLTSH